MYKNHAWSAAYNYYIQPQLRIRDAISLTRELECVEETATHLASKLKDVGSDPTIKFVALVIGQLRTFLLSITAFPDAAFLKSYDLASAAVIKHQPLFRRPERPAEK